jgi:hypothetical protein
MNLGDAEAAFNQPKVLLAQSRKQAPSEKTLIRRGVWLLSVAANK